jgi:1-deoxy-D-xylulose-5-phosphate synthase
MLDPALEAAEALAEDGIEATVWDVRCVKPADPELLEDAASHPTVITVEDGYKAGGAGSLLASGIRGCCEDRLVPRIEILGVPTQYVDHAKVDDILARLGLDGAGIAASVRRAVGAPSPL